MKKYLLSIFAIGLVLRLGYLFLFSAGRPVHIDEWSYYQLVNEFWLAGVDSNFVYHPPLYPLFMLAIFKVVGVSFIALQVIQLLMGGLTAVLAALIGKEVGNEKIGLIAGLVYAVSIRPVQMPVMLLSETLFTFLLILAVWLFIKAIKKPQPQISPIAQIGLRKICGYLCKLMVSLPNHPWFLLTYSGLLFGLAALTRSIALVLPFLLAGYLIIRKEGRAKFLRSAIFVVIFAVTLLPWVIRNYRITGRFMPGSASYGNTFFWHNTDTMWAPGSDYISDIKLEDFKRYSGRLGNQVPQEYYHPSIKQMHQLIEGKNMAGPLAQADFYFNYTKEHLKTLSFRQIVKLELVKLYRLVLPYHPYYNPFPDLTFMITLIFFCIFIYYFRRRNVSINLMKEGIMVLWILIGYLLIMTLVFGGMPRYRDPYDPYIIILAVIGAKELASRLRRTVRPIPAPNRL